MLIDRYVVKWSGFVGAPGFTNLYMKNADGIDRSSKVRALFEGLSLAIPNSVSIQCPSEGDTFDSVTGALTGLWSVAATNLAPVIGAGGGEYAGPVGAVISWGTMGINGGHKVRGRTFIVPTSTATFTVTGELNTQSYDRIVAAASAFQLSLAGTFGIWSKPRKAALPSVHHPLGVTARDGLFAPVTSSAVRRFGAVLRSRRD